MRQKYSLLYAKFLRYGIAGIMIVAPFYAPLSVWVGSRLKHLDFFKIWKEFALTLLGVVIATFLVTHHLFMRRVIKSRLAIVVTLYILLIVFIGVYDLASHRVGNKAVIYGILVDLRPIAFFGVTFLTFAISAQRRLAGFAWRRIILIPASVVIAFGLLQMTVLPPDILTHIGYSKSTIVPYQTVDNQSDFVRIQSTLRGANPLGAYMILIITMLVAAFMADRKRRVLWGVFTIGSLAVLFGTYSRSAEVGLILALLLLIVIQNRKFVSKHMILIIFCAVLAVTAFVGVARHNYVAQNIVFHSSDKSRSSISSNSERTAAMTRAAKDVWRQPLGTGVGSAGPASARNTEGELRIAENYFLQIGQELGVAGMLLFITINIMVAKELWRRRSNQLARVLLASLVGITFVNLVSHAWTDDTLAYLWWGLAGIACAPVIASASRSPAQRRTR